jgi:HTH-type transcriptional regulator / antitoxin HigA
MIRTKFHARSAADDYLNLIGIFPLRKLQNDRDHAEGVRILGRLLGRPDDLLSAGEEDYAETLVLLLKEYEDRRPRAQRRKSKPLELLKSLVEEAAMNTEALGMVLGSQTAASLVLNGKRQLSKNHIRALADYFKIDPGAFF